MKLVFSRYKFFLWGMFILASCGYGSKSPGFITAELSQGKVPLFIGRQNTGVIEVTLQIDDEQKTASIRSVEIVFDHRNVGEIVDHVKVWHQCGNTEQENAGPAWQLLLAGPGMGITLDDGTLIFAAQFKEDIGVQAVDGGQYTCHSTIIYSRDGGKTWAIGTGAKPNTTEAQVVQLADGGLMLNMRDDLNRTAKDETNGRAVSVTYDLGQTWVAHPSSNVALSEPNCMASLISHDMRVNGQIKQVLFFSNPNDKHNRVNMTVKASFDEGHTWPETNQVLLNDSPGFGYSCMTMIDEITIGILYEGYKELFFQKIPISQFIKNSKK